MIFESNEDEEEEYRLLDKEETKLLVDNVLPAVAEEKKLLDMKIIKILYNSNNENEAPKATTTTNKRFDYFYLMNYSYY